MDYMNLYICFDSINFVHLLDIQNISDTAQSVVMFCCNDRVDVCEKSQTLKSHTEDLVYIIMLFEVIVMFMCETSRNWNPFCPDRQHLIDFAYMLCIQYLSDIVSCAVILCCNIVLMFVRSH